MDAEFAADIAAVAHNDQVRAAASDDLDELLIRARATFAQADEKGHSRVIALAVIADTLIEQEEVMHRRRLGSLLAVALERLIGYEDAHG